MFVYLINSKTKILNISFSILKVHTNKVEALMSILNCDKKCNIIERVNFTIIITIFMVTFLPMDYTSIFKNI